jgi:DNA repair exonuclease SbcCD ATPase subunit
MTNKYLSKFASPSSKLIRFFEGSRNRWKEKQKELRKERKLLLNQTRAVEKSRQEWRQRASAAESRLKELEREIEDLKSRGRPASPR